MALFIELTRIKKPHRSAFQAGRMLCMLVNAFRDKPLVHQFLHWEAIISFMDSSNLSRFTREVQAIKVKLDPFAHCLNDLIEIRNLFFSETNQPQSDRAVKAIVCFVQAVVFYVLDREKGGVPC